MHIRTFNTQSTIPSRPSGAVHLAGLLSYIVTERSSLNLGTPHISARSNTIPNLSPLSIPPDSLMVAPLQPAPHAVGVFSFYTQHSTPIALKIREKKFTFTGDDFNIKDAATGAIVFRVDGKVFSMRGRKGLPLLFDRNAVSLTQCGRVPRQRWEAPVHALETAVQYPHNVRGP